MVLSSSEGESSGLCPLLEGGGLTLLTLETERPKLGPEGFLDGLFRLVKFDNKDM